VQGYGPAGGVGDVSITRRRMTRLTGGVYGRKAVNLQQFDNFLDWLVSDGKGGDTPQELYAAVAWMFWCVNLRADSVAQIPYAIYPESVKEADETEDNAVEWDIPLEWMLWQVEAWMCLKAVAYVLKRANSVVLKDLQVLNANTMRVKAFDAEGPTVFEQRVGAQSKLYSADEILYFRTWSYKTDIGPGIAAGAVGTEAASLIKNANQWASSFFENGAIPAVLLSSDSMINPADAKEVETRWERMLKGVQRAFKTIALGSGLKPVVIGQPIKDLAMPDLERTRKEQILAAHKIPPGLAEAKTNRAERDSLQFELWTQCIVPEVAIHIAPVLNKQLFNPLGLRISFHYSEIEVIQREEIAKAESSAFMVNGVILPAYEANVVSIDETRRVINGVLRMADMPKLDDTFEPEERAPAIPFGGAAPDSGGGGDREGPGNPTPPGENAGNNTRPKAVAPEWGRHRVSLLS